MCQDCQAIFTLLRLIFGSKLTANKLGHRKINHSACSKLVRTRTMFCLRSFLPLIFLPLNASPLQVLDLGLELSSLTLTKSTGLLFCFCSPLSLLTGPALYVPPNPRVSSAHQTRTCEIYYAMPTIVNSFRKEKLTRFLSVLFGSTADPLRLLLSLVRQMLCGP